MASTAEPDALPQQVQAALPAEVTGVISNFAELVPGVTWSNQLMHELYESLCDENCWHKNVQVEGFDKVAMFLRRQEVRPRRKGQVVYEVKASINCYSGVYDRPAFQYEIPAEKKATFPDSPQGVRDAFEFLKEKKNWLKRRGFCRGCLDQEPPKKRIRLSTIDVCSECLMGRV